TPNLKLQNASIPTTASTGDSKTISFNVLSETTSLNNVTVKVYVDDVNIYTDTRNYDVNSAVSHSTSWTSTAGSHTIKVSIDPANTVSESSEADNNSSETITVTTPTTNTGGTTSGTSGGTTGGTSNSNSSSGTSYTSSYATPKISSAESLKTTSSELTALFSSINYALSNEAQALIDSANNKLNDALQAQSDGKYQKAGQYADEAKKLFEQAQKLMPGVSSNEITAEFASASNSVNAEGIEADTALLEGYSSELAGLIGYARNATVYSIKENNEEAFRTIIKVKVKSNALKAVNGIEVRETVPKSVAEKASQLSGNFKVIEEDPVIAWTVSLNAGEETELSYVVNKKVEEAELKAFEAVKTVMSLSDEGKCGVINVDDSNPCTQDSCELGVVSHTALPDSEACEGGQPKQATTPTTSPTGLVGLLGSSGSLILGGIIAAALVGMAFFKRENIKAIVSGFGKKAMATEKKPVKAKGKASRKTESIKGIKEEIEKEAEEAY
ncbi:hypothetical protein HZB89_01365, partial [archaeon]|nr:hypothetical protein [archaeon]